MTQNQLRYWENVETQRANRAREENERNTLSEKIRSNLANEGETHRSNLARENETYRSNIARETENTRTNVENEAIKRGSLFETNRSNLAKEQETTRSNKAKEEQARAELELSREVDRRNASTKEVEAREKERHNKQTEYYQGLETGSKVGSSLVDAFKSGLGIFGGNSNGKTQQNQRPRKPAIDYPG